MGLDNIQNILENMTDEKSDLAAIKKVWPEVFNGDKLNTELLCKKVFELGAETLANMAGVDL